MPALSVYLLGTPRFEVDNQIIEFPTAKALALAAYAAVSPGKHLRESLITMFWPEMDTEAAQHALRTTIWRLKKNLSPWIEAKRTFFEIRKTPDLWVDVLRFSQLLESCRSHPHDKPGFNSLDYPHSRKRELISCPGCLPLLDEAVSLYHSGFMEGFTLRDSLNFDRWQRNLSEHLHYGVCESMERLVAAYQSLGRPHDAIACAQRWCKLAPSSEEALRQLMWLTYLSGDRTAAVNLYQEYEAAELIPDRLEPEEQTIFLLRTLQEKTTPRPSLETRSNHRPAAKPVPLLNVPTLLTPFVGRDSEMNIIQTNLHDPACRFLNLVGIGGTGKTRLAVQTAQSLANEQFFPCPFTDGICFVPLASETQVVQIPSGIAAALGYSFYGREPQVTQLAAYLRRKSILLILDNLEQIPGTYEIIIRLLEAAPNLKILATSRSRLNVRGEWIQVIHGLDYPISAEFTSLDAFAAVRLFKDCVRRGDPTFFLWEEDAAYLVRICKMLDGLPLGIEMAASAMRNQSLKEIAESIETNLDFLVLDQLDVPHRQNSLRAIFDYTWKSLTAQEQNLLFKLSVYSGGFSREQAESFARITPRHISDMVDKMILRRLSPNRYELLELFKLFVSSKLEKYPSLFHEINNEHCRQMADFLEERKDLLRGPRQFQALAEIRQEMENILAAWLWAVQHRNFDLLGKMEETLSQVMVISGSFQISSPMINLAVEAFSNLKIPVSDFPPELMRIYTRILLARAKCSHRLGQQAEALALLKECKEHSSRIGDRLLFANILNAEGQVKSAGGCYEEAYDLQRQGLEIATELGDLWTIANFHLSLGTLSSQPVESVRYYREALRLFRQIGDPLVIACCQINLADAELNQGEFLEAKQLSQDSLETLYRLDSKHSIAICLSNIAIACAGLEEYGEAVEYYERSLENYREVGNPVDITIIEMLLAVSEWHTGGQEKGWARIIQALRTLQLNPNRPLALEIITVFSEYKYTEEARLCAALLSCVIHHPAVWGRTSEKAAELLAVVKSCLPDEAYNDAVLQGMTLDPLDAAGSLLKKYAA